MAWRVFAEDVNALADRDHADHGDPDRERALDDRWNGDVLTLAAVFRIDLGAMGGVDPRTAMALVLRRLSRDVTDPASFVGQVLDDHGPEAVLRALLRAYTTPQEVSDEVVHP